MSDQDPAANLTNETLAAVVAIVMPHGPVVPAALLMRAREQIADLTTERDELRRRIAVLLDAEGVVEPLADGERCPRCGFKQRSGRCQCDVAVPERRLELVRDTHPDHVEADATLRAYLRSQGREVPDERGVTPEAARAHVREHRAMHEQTMLDRMGATERRVNLCVEHMEQRYGELDRRMERYVDNFATEVADLAAKSAQLTELVVELSKDVQALAGKAEA